MKIFIDDERTPETHQKYLNQFGVDSFNNYEGFVVVKNFCEFKKCVIKNGLPTHLSFDHDLGGGPEGIDCLKWIVNYHLDNDIKWKIECRFHTANPI